MPLETGYVGLTRRAGSASFSETPRQGPAPAQSGDSALLSLILFVLVLGIVFYPRVAYAGDVENISYVERGFFRIFTAAFQLPRYLIQETFAGPPVIGILDGALTGVYYTVASLVGGTFDLLRGTIPYAKYLVFFA